MANLCINNRVFERSLTLRQAYAVLERFIEAYNARGESSTVALLTDISLGADGTSCDPAQIYDFAYIAADVLGDHGLRDAVRSLESRPL